MSTQIPPLNILKLYKALGLQELCQLLGWRVRANFSDKNFSVIHVPKASWKLDQALTLLHSVGIIKEINKINGHDWDGQHDYWRFDIKEPGVWS